LRLAREHVVYGQDRAWVQDEIDTLQYDSDTARQRETLAWIYDRIPEIEKLFAEEPYMPWPPMNVVKYAATTQRSKHHSFVGFVKERLGCSESLARKLVSGKTGLSAKKISRLLDAIPIRPRTLLIQHVMWQHEITWPFVQDDPHPMHVPRNWWSCVPEGAAYGFPESVWLHYLVVFSLQDVWQSRTQICACESTECDRLFIPSKQGHRQRFCSTKCRKRQEFLDSYKGKATSQSQHAEALED
jgi:hypothetical protein